MPITYVLYQDIRLVHQHHRIQSSGWIAYQRVMGNISTMITYSSPTSHSVNLPSNKLRMRMIVQQTGSKSHLGLHISRKGFHIK